MRYGLALIGFGGVNRALAEILHQKGEELHQKFGVKISIVSVSDIFFGQASNEKGLDFESLINLPQRKGALALLSNGNENPDNDAAICAPGVDIIVEATYTNPVDGEPAVSHCRTALANKKHIVTTNKGPVALFGNELSKLAKEQNVSFEFEGTVMSGTPVLRFAKETLKGCDIKGFRGILNGTANVVLGEVEAGASMVDAIKKAQELGYAEANPDADIKGLDVMLKVTILANQLLGANIKPEYVNVGGITAISKEDICSAVVNGKRWKLIGQAMLDENGNLSASVGPECISTSDPLAGVSGPINAIALETDFLGTVMLSGPGAGRTETAYALLADIITIHETSGLL